MSDITTAIRKLTLQRPSIADAVGQRMTTDTLVQGSKLPAITYWTIDTVPNEHLTAEVPLYQARIQIDCFAETRGESVSLSDEVRLQLAKFRGDVDGQFINEISVASGQEHQYDRPESATDTRRFWCSQDFFVSYRETVEV